MELDNTIEMIDSENDNIDDQLGNLKGQLERRKLNLPRQPKRGITNTQKKREAVVMAIYKSKQQRTLRAKREEGAPVLRNLAAIFGASYEFINNNIITPTNVGVFAGIIKKMIFIMQHPIDTFFGALDCYNRFLISAIGNKLTTILNSITIAGLTLGGAGLIGHAALVDTLNEQNLLQSAATLYYSSQFFEPTMQTLSAAVYLGDSIKIYLMKKFPKALEDNINTVTESIQTKIDSLAKKTKEMNLTDTKNKIQAITDFTKNIKNNVIIVENGEEIALMTPEDIALLENYLNENAERAAGLKEGGPGPGEGPFGQEKEEEGSVKGGKKHKKSNKKRHQKTHKKQLKPKAKSHKKKNKPKAKSHKKK